MPPVLTIIFALFLVDGKVSFLNGYAPMPVANLEHCEQLLATTTSVTQTPYPYKASCFVGTVEEFKEMVEEMERNPVGFIHPGEPA